MFVLGYAVFSMDEFIIIVNAIGTKPNPIHKRTTTRDTTKTADFKHHKVTKSK